MLHCFNAASQHGYKGHKVAGLQGYRVRMVQVYKSTRLAARQKATRLPGYKSSFKATGLHSYKARRLQGYRAGFNACGQKNQKHKGASQNVTKR